jgi:hypothetical protein
MEDSEQPATDSAVQDVPDSPEIVETLETTETPETVVVDDSEEIDYEGEKYKVPSKIKDAIMRHADYTQKTQAIAQQRQDFEAAQQAFAAQQQFQEQHIEAVSEVKAIDRQLAQFSKLDWNALTDADPVQALKLDRQMRELQQQRAASVQSITDAQNRHQFESSQATARTLETARAQLSREIQGYGTPELTKALAKVGEAHGYNAKELSQVNDPRAVKLLHKAYLYDQLVSKQKAPTPTNVTPITRVSGSSATASKSIGDASLSDAEYNRMRREYIQKHR